MNVNPYLWFGEREINHIPPHFIKANTLLTDDSLFWVMTKCHGRYAISDIQEETYEYLNNTQLTPNAFDYMGTNYNPQFYSIDNYAAPEAVTNVIDVLTKEGLNNKIQFLNVDLWDFIKINDEKHDLIWLDVGNGEEYMELLHGSVLSSQKLAKLEKQGDTGIDILDVSNGDSVDDDDEETESEYESTGTVEVFGESDVEELETFQKVKIEEIGELEMILPESIQRGDLLQYKMEKIPKLLQQNPDIINNLNKQMACNFIDLIYRLLSYSPTDRITSEEALDHPIFRMGG